MSRRDGRRRVGSRGRVVRGAALSGGALLLAGCATMPDSGPIPAGSAEPTGSTQNTRAELIAAPPKDNESPQQLVNGFLDGLASDEANYTMARRYLAEGTTWDPLAKVTVVGSAIPDNPVFSPDGKTARVQVTGIETATLDVHGSYTPGSGAQVTQEFVFAKNDKNQWRIKTLPPGILITQQDFPRIYESVNLFFPASRGLTYAGVSPLVADPVYLRSRIDPLTTAARQLLAGPSSWLNPVVASPFPSKSTLDLDTSSDQAKVYLTLGPGGLWSSSSCKAMAAQFYATLTQLEVRVPGVTKPKSVALYQGHSGGEQCTANGEGDSNPVRPTAAATAYFLNAQHHLMSVTPPASGTGDADVTPVSGQLVPPNTVVGSFAVTPRGDGAVAAVSESGQSLYLSSLQATMPPSRPTLQSAAPYGLSAPSWDGTGTLWVADTDPKAPRLRAVMDGKEVSVSVDGLQGVVQQVRVAPDGVRVALLVKDGTTTRVEIGRVLRGGNDNAPRLSVDGLRETAQDISSISSLAWQDGDSLVIVGQQTGTTSVIAVEMDGSPAASATLQALNGVTDITANPGEPDQPLFAAANNSSNQVFFQQSLGTWATIARPDASKGTAVRYPG
ncbi:hypothetical protein ABIA32_004369 [Streptacidiphilus sp. MAP12-20]|uniref:LpqB family beta-propeller domain-containing protein n=1 Tax=Streptacidiphilus sp. MAP12-20 TaxID=3156299 RepID=UPI0035193371